MLRILEFWIWGGGTFGTEGYFGKFPNGERKTLVSSKMVVLNAAWFIGGVSKQAAERQLAPGAFISHTNFKTLY